MGKKMPKYAVFNMNIGREYHEVAETGDDLDDLLVRYHGKAIKSWQLSQYLNGRNGNHGSDCKADEGICRRTWVHELVGVS